MKIRRKISDFVCAFFVFVIILLSIVSLTGESFFEGTVEWDREEAVLSVLGTEFAFDRNFPSAAKRFLSFNDILFGKGFSKGVACAAEFVADYVADGLSLAYCAAKIAI